MDEQETIADIIAEKRRRAEHIRKNLSTVPVRRMDQEAEIKSLEDEADRLEAAYKRELSKNGADFGQLGDAAKLREALVQAELFVGNIVRHGHQTLVPGDKCTACDGAEELRDMICAALAEPVRNCDRFATVDEARKAHEEYRGDYIMRASNKFDFPMKFEAWLFAPATEKEGGEK